MNRNVKSLVFFLLFSPLFILCNDQKNQNTAYRTIANHYKTITNHIEKVLKKDTSKAVLAGMLSQIIVESTRNHLSEARYLYPTFGICRDRLTGLAAMTAALIGLEIKESDKSRNKAKNYTKRVAGVLAGILSIAFLRKTLLGDAHQFLNS